MSEYLVKGKILQTKHIWFDTEAGKGGDHVIIHGLTKEKSEHYKSNKFCQICEQHTLISDISGSENEIFGFFSSTVRNEINRSKKDATRLEFISSEEFISNETFRSSFSEMYSAMYESKGMSVALNITELIAYAKKGDLLVSVAYMNNIPIVYHSYIVSGENARLLHSCSEFRTVSKDERNFIGRANKHLHFGDMLYLKTRGVKKYDWGGIASFDEPNGIDKFKMSFGGGQTTYYNVIIAKSIPAKCISLVKKVLEK